MKRWIGGLAFSLVSSSVLAQAPFTIVRPFDGARVREKVKIEIPKGSIPANGYVGIFLDDKFIEATRPPLIGKFFVYTLDTKARHIADSQRGKPYKLEVKLFSVYENVPRIVDHSSVEIFVANTSSIKVPEDGISLRYHWKAGTEHIYHVNVTVKETAISDQQEKNGGTASEVENTVPLDIRMLYSVDRSFPNGDGLLRMQALPNKGQDFLMASIGVGTEPQRYDQLDCAPIYMRVSPTGNEIWGTVPRMSPGDVIPQTGGGQSLYADFPLPSLPYSPVHPGDAWRSHFLSQDPSFLTSIGTKNSVVKTYPARGEFVGVEWEMGHPCAIIRNTIGTSEISDQDRKLASVGGVQPTKLKEDETLWFALDTRQMLKIVRVLEVDAAGTNEALGFASNSGPGGATGGGGGGFPGGGGGGFPGGAGGFPGGGRNPGGNGFPGAGGGFPGGRGGDGGDDLNSPISIKFQRFPGRGGMGGPRGGSGYGSGPGGFGAGGFGPGGMGPGGMGGGGMGRSGAPNPQQMATVHVIVTETFVLER